MHKFSSLLLFSSILVNSLSADPSNSVRTLMNEPATMFDIGMMRIRSDNHNTWIPKLLVKVKDMPIKLDPNGGNSAVYSFEKNKINISATFIGKPSEETCKNVLKIYKEIIVPSPIIDQKDRNRFLAVQFDHINFSKTAKTDAYYEDMASLYEFTIGIHDGDIYFGKSIFCSSFAWDVSPQITKYK